MKKLFTLCKVAASAIAICATVTTVNAAVYTATASGNFNSTTTWSGGMIPPSPLAGDAIVIPNGITVTLDQTQEINGALSALTVDGTLDASMGALVMVMGNLSGNGTITADSLHLENAIGLTFTGDINATKLSTTGLSLNTLGNVTIADRLYLTGGTLDLGNNSLNLMSNVALMIDGGTLSTSGTGAITGTIYDVVYINSSATTGLELMGTGLNMVEVNVGSGNTVILSSDLDADGIVTINSGTLDLNGNDLMLHAGIMTKGSGMIMSDKTSDIMLSATATGNSSLRFDNNENVVGNLTVNLTGANSMLEMNSDANVDGTLDLQAGKINLMDHDLRVDGGMTVATGGNSYIITGSNGSVMTDLGASISETFHIGIMNGTTAMYTPIMVTVNPGSTGGTIAVSANSDVYVNSMSGAKLNTDQPLVNATWHVMTDASSNINMSIQPMWSSNMEVNSFNRATAYVSTYTNNAWSTGTVGAATTINGMYTLTPINVTQANSAVAVFDEKAVTTSIANVSADNGFAIYPNPAANVISFKAPQGSLVESVAIYNVTGKLMKTATFNSNSNSVSVSELPTGMYSVKIIGNNFSTTERFVKQ